MAPIVGSSGSNIRFNEGRVVIALWFVSSLVCARGRQAELNAAMLVSVRFQGFSNIKWGDVQAQGWKSLGLKASTSNNQKQCVVLSRGLQDLKSKTLNLFLS